MDVLVNGKQQSFIQTHDRGLLYGDGFFTTIKVLAGKPQLWSYHFQRLQRDAKRLNIALADESVFVSEIKTLLNNSSQTDAVIRITLTRGLGPRGYLFPAETKVTRILSLHELSVFPQSCYSAGIKVRICDLRLARNEVLAGIKHLNRLEQVLARNEWHTAEYQEGLLLDCEDNVIEGCSSNILILKKGSYFTPKLQFSGVQGVMLDFLTDRLSEQGQVIEQTDLSLQDVLTADAVFMLNSIIGIWPVSSINQQQYSSHRYLAKLLDVVELK